MGFLGNFVRGLSREKISNDRQPSRKDNLLPVHYLSPRCVCRKECSISPKTFVQVNIKAPEG